MHTIKATSVGLRSESTNCVVSGTPGEPTDKAKIRTAVIKG